MFRNFRIIPLLVLVAMLSFSFRLAEVVSGFSSLSGAAKAEQEIDNAVPPVFPDTHSTESDDAASEDSASPSLVFEGETAAEDEEAEEKITLDELPPVEWRDASDADIDLSETRMELFQDLAARRVSIEKRERNIMAREALLSAAEQELDRKYQELSQLRAEIERLLEMQSDEEQARLDSLVKIYEGMKPKDAARIFDTLDLDILVPVMSKMSERKLSPVLANMNPERARAVTIMLAEQKQLPSLPQGN